MMFDIHFGDVLGHSIKLYALMTPPAVLSAFLGHTRNYDKQHKHAIAFKTSLSIFIISVVLYVWGAKIFEIFGFTLDAFRIGSGMLLMLAAIDLMKDDGTSTEIKSEGDISVVPLAIPLGMGPASIGAVMVMGAKIWPICLPDFFPFCWLHWECMRFCWPRILWGTFYIPPALQYWQN